MENLFGRTYESLGTTDSDLILKTRGLVKIQIGRSLIDLVKNNKINVDLNIIKEVTSKEDIDDNGIFIVNALDVYLKYENKLLALLDTTNSSNVSYLPLLNITYESKILALKNLGLYYNTIEEAVSEIPNGFAYIENSLYNIINSLAYKVISGNIFDSITANTLNTTQGIFGDISISLSTISLLSLTSIKSSSQTLMRFDDNKVFIDSPITVDEILSNNGSFRLTTAGNTSRLKVTYIEALEQYLGVDLINITFRRDKVEDRTGDMYDTNENIKSDITETTRFPRLEDGWKQDKDLDGQALTSAAWVRKYGYELNIATKDSLGGVKVGDGLSITSDGLLSINDSYNKNISSLQTDLTSLTNKVTNNTTKITELETLVANLQKVVKELQEKLNSSSE